MFGKRKGPSRPSEPATPPQDNLSAAEETAARPAAAGGKPPMSATGAAVGSSKAPPRRQETRVPSSVEGRKLVLLRRAGPRHVRLRALREQGELLRAVLEDDDLVTLHVTADRRIRQLSPGGRALVLEFSHPRVRPLARAYDAYSFSVLPLMGRMVVGDADSYRYLAESIRMHPDQETLLSMLEQAGFERAGYVNLTGGIVAIHRGYKL
jgi:hypothetical protein